MSDKKWKAGAVANHLNELSLVTKKGKEYKGKHIDNRRVDGSLPRFVYEKRGENYYYDPAAVDWLAFMNALRESNHTGATYQNMKIIFEEALKVWGPTIALTELQRRFDKDFARFLRELLVVGLQLPSELEDAAAPPLLSSSTPPSETA